MNTAHDGLALQLQRILENTRRDIRANALGYRAAFDAPNPPSRAQLAAVVRRDAELYLEHLQWVLDAFAQDEKAVHLNLALRKHRIGIEHLQRLHTALTVAAEAQALCDPADFDGVAAVVVPMVDAAPGALLSADVHRALEDQRAHRHVPDAHSIWPVR